MQHETKSSILTISWQVKDNFTTKQAILCAEELGDVVYTDLMKMIFTHNDKFKIDLLSKRFKITNI